MTQERTYPREWFTVSGGHVHSQTFTGETAHKLKHEFCGKESLVSKVTIYSTWYPTREEAQAIADANMARKAEQARLKRIRDAAPALLEALEELRKWQAPCGQDPDIDAALAKADAAIAQAKGEV